MGKVMLLDPSGSAPIVTHNLANALARRGWIVDLYTSPHYSRLVRCYEHVDYRIVEHFYRRGQSPSYAARTLLGRGMWRGIKLVEHMIAMHSIMRSVAQYDLIHVQWFTVPALDWLWLWRARNRAPAVYTVHNLRPHDHFDSRISRILFPSWAYREIYHLADALIVHTEFTRRGLVQEFGVPDDKIFKIRHGAADHLRRPPSPGPVQAGVRPRPGTRTILFFGSIRHNKGLDVLLRAVGRIVRMGGDICLVVAGRSDIDEGSILSLVEEIGIKKHVEFHFGYVQENEVAGYFERADLVVLPYRVIDQSGVAVVACSFGKAIVATRCGGLEELVEEARNGLLVPIDDDKALAEAMVRVLSDGALRALLEHRSQAYAQTALSWETVSAATAAVYQWVLNDHGSTQTGRIRAAMRKDG